jgi:hypothetical protein
MNTVEILLAANTAWTYLNIRLASKGRQNSIGPLNMVFDFFIWALLIAFGVSNTVEAL